MQMEIEANQEVLPGALPIMGRNSSPLNLQYLALRRNESSFTLIVLLSLSDFSSISFMEGSLVVTVCDI